MTKSVIKGKRRPKRHRRKWKNTVRKDKTTKEELIWQRILEKKRRSRNRGYQRSSEQSYSHQTAHIRSSYGSTESYSPTSRSANLFSRESSSFENSDFTEERRPYRSSLELDRWEL